MINRANVQFTQSNQVRGQYKAKSYAEAVKDKAFQALGEGMGLGFSFLENEEILFPKLEEAFPFTKKFRDTEILYIAGWSEKRHRFVDIPLSTFRKRPVGENESIDFYNEETHPLNCRLAEASNDLERFRILCEVGCIVCTDIYDVHAWVFEKDADGNPQRTDKMKPLKVAAVAAVTEDGESVQDSNAAA